MLVDLRYSDRRGKSAKSRMGASLSSLRLKFYFSVHFYLLFELFVLFLMVISMGCC